MGPRMARPSKPFVGLLLFLVLLARVPHLAPPKCSCQKLFLAFVRNDQ